MDSSRWLLVSQVGLSTESSIADRRPKKVVGGGFAVWMDEPFPGHLAYKPMLIESVIWIWSETPFFALPHAPRDALVRTPSRPVNSQAVWG